MYQVSRPMGLIRSDLFKDKIFLFGLALKLIFLSLFIPEIQSNWFNPFVLNSIQSLDLDPWTNFIEKGGDPLSFPYGPIMLSLLVPITLIGNFLDILIGINYFSGFGFRITLLAADILLLLTLLRQFEKHWKGILIHYWLSPLVILITYWHGQVDIIPLALFLYSASLLKDNTSKLSGVFLALAVAAKHSMLLGLPFILIYLWFKKEPLKGISYFLACFAIVLVSLEGFLFLSEGFQEMVLQSREIDKIYWLTLPMGENLNIYLIPLVYLFLIYFTWQLQKINFDLFMATLGVAFGIVILLTPSTVGWFIWLTPMLALHLSRSNFDSKLIGIIFSVIFVLYHFLFSSGSHILFFNNLFTDPGLYIDLSNLLELKSLLNTLLIGLLALITLQMYTGGIRGSDFYHLGKKPVVLGIAGDSGTGKTTFGKALIRLFGANQVLEIEGDDYHNWDRSSPMWKTMTHLDPRANNLFKMVSDLHRMLDGEFVKVRSYNHKTGRFMSEVSQRGNQVILVSGLHSLYPKQLLDVQDVSFFLEIEEDLRTKLKIDRDFQGRQKDKKKTLEEINKRKSDGKKYIEPQKKNADVTFKLLLINKDKINSDLPLEKNLKLQVRIRNGAYYHELLRVLIGICDLQVNIEEFDERGSIELDIQGEVRPEDIRLASSMIVPHLDEFIEDHAGFEEGMLGIMQLVTMIEIDQALRNRKR